MNAPCRWQLRWRLAPTLVVALFVIGLLAPAHVAAEETTPLAGRDSLSADERLAEVHFDHTRSDHAFSDQALVGNDGDRSIVTPVNQVVTPHGRQVDLPGMRPQALALSPDGKLLATSGKTNQLVLFDPDQATIVGRVSFPSDDPTLAPPAGSAPPASPQPPVSPQILKPDRKSQVSFTGLVYSPAGDRIYLSNVEGLV